MKKHPNNKAGRKHNENPPDSGVADRLNLMDALNDRLLRVRIMAGLLACANQEELDGDYATKAGSLMVEDIEETKALLRRLSQK
ncbi:MAG: hypothetical protein PHV34_24260 [Verrucomicrobiae bacterium]|nr:hypothetical protein [Verrucomicrobiae bacterium]